MNIRSMNNLQITSWLMTAVLLESLLPSVMAQEQRRGPQPREMVAAARRVSIAAAAKKPLGVVAQIAAVALAGQSTTLLPDGRWLVLGGADVSGPVARAGVKSSREASASAFASAGLQHARAWHTATVLPDGSVFVFGGVGAKSLITEAELFDPASQTFSALEVNLEARAYHTATLLTDGRVLIAGGIDKDGKLVGRIEIWDPRAKAVQALPVGLAAPRRGHTATLQADGNVLIRGGVLADGSAAVQGELVRADTLSVDSVAAALEDAETPHVMASIPVDGAIDVAVDTVLALRFSKLLRVATVNASTITLNSANGPAAAKVVGAEGGRLAFLSLEGGLQAGTTYSISVAGSSDVENSSLQPARIQFTTRSVNAPAGPATSSTSAKPGEKDDPELPALQVPAGVTALAGQVYTIEGKYLPEVTLELDCGKVAKEKRYSAQSDRTGRFLISNVPSGHCELIIDGTTAKEGKNEYGLFMPGVDIAKGITNVLPYIIWM